MRGFGWLQLFAEGESPAAESAVTDGDGAGQDPRATARVAPTEGDREGAQTVMSWDDFMAIPENAARLQEMLDGRDRDSAGGDPRATARVAPTADNRDGAGQDSAREARLRRHFAGMLRQAERLREVFPDFDLRRELEDPEFLRRTLPESGMSVEDAFYSLHHGEILRRQAEAVALRSRADAAAALRLGERPRENGASANAAALGTPDLRHMSRRDKIAYIRAKYPSRF